MNYVNARPQKDWKDGTEQPQKRRHIQNSWKSSRANTFIKKSPYSNGTYKTYSNADIVS